MNKKKKILFFIFVMGFLATILGLPLLYALGVPSFSVLLDELFGEKSILAVAFSLLLLFFIFLGVGKVINKA